MTLWDLAPPPATPWVYCVEGYKLRQREWGIIGETSQCLTGACLLPFSCAIKHRQQGVANEPQSTPA